MATQLTDNTCRSCGGSTGETVADHEAKADPHAQYLQAADLSSYATDAEVATAISDHEALANPHPTYLTQTEADALYDALGDATTAVTTHETTYDHTTFATESFAEDRTGWESYTDTAVTSGSPQTLVASTPTDLTNAGDSTVTAEAPSDVTAFYDTVGGTIEFGTVNELLEIQVELTCDPTTTGQWLDIWLEDGAAGEISRQTFSLIKGAAAHEVTWRALVPATANLVANGGTVRVESGDTPDLYDISFLIARGHKVRTT